MHAGRGGEQRDEREHAPVAGDVDEDAVALRRQRGDEDARQRLRQHARRRAAPAAAISRLSASSCRTMRPRDAPSARRTAISRSRAVARASIRFARLAQAMSSTSAGRREQQPERRFVVVAQTARRRCRAGTRAEREREVAFCVLGAVVRQRLLEHAAPRSRRDARSPARSSSPASGGRSTPRNHASFRSSAAARRRATAARRRAAPRRRRCGRPRRRRTPAASRRRCRRRGRRASSVRPSADGLPPYSRCQNP